MLICFKFLNRNYEILRCLPVHTSFMTNLRLLYVSIHINFYQNQFINEFAMKNFQNFSKRQSKLAILYPCTIWSFTKNISSSTSHKKKRPTILTGF